MWTSLLTSVQGHLFLLVQFLRAIHVLLCLLWIFLWISWRSKIFLLCLTNLSITSNLRMWSPISFLEDIHRAKDTSFGSEALCLLSTGQLFQAWQVLLCSKDSVAKICSYCWLLLLHVLLRWHPASPKSTKTSVAVILVGKARASQQ